MPLRHGLQDETDPLRDKDSGDSGDSGVRVDEWFGTLYGLCACTSRPFAVMVFLVVAAERFVFPLFLFRLPSFSIFVAAHSMQGRVTDERDIE